MPDHPRLPHIRPFAQQPLVFLTVVTHERRPALACASAHDTLCSIWANSPDLDGWTVGRYVLMPDHAHLFARATWDAKPLARWVQIWKSLSSRRLSETVSLPRPSGKRTTSTVSSARRRATPKSGATSQVIPCGPGFAASPKTGRGRGCWLTSPSSQTPATGASPLHILRHFHCTSLFASLGTRRPRRVLPYHPNVPAPQTARPCLCRGTGPRPSRARHR